MSPVGILSTQNITLLASALRTSLQFQPNVGTEAQRSRWFRSLDDTEALAASPVGPLARFFLGEGWNLHRAKERLGRVSSQAVSAGLLLADARDGFIANAARFASADAAVSKARVYVLRSRSIHEERSHERAERLVRTLFGSKVSAHETLVAMLDRAFEMHIRKLDASVAMIPDLVIGEDIPSDAAYPHYFEDAHPHLMDYLHRTLAEINGGLDFNWDECRSETVGRLIELRLEREGIDAKTADGGRKRRGLSLATQISEYSAFQLFCLLLQIRDGRPETALVRELERSRNGRLLDFDDAICAGLTWGHLLKASELIGNIDIIHANIGTACEMAKYEQPEVDEQIIVLQVKAAVARLGKATGSSRHEYDGAIERLRALETDPNAGRVIPLSRRRS
ncbi:MAG TPA: hypothetical protein VLJ37_03700 [bacterium]|nr:hypothetical protein [bacterium]